MTHSISQRRAQAEAFSKRWRERGVEKSDAQSFWTDMLRTIYEYETPESVVQFEQGTEYGGWIDGVVEHARVFIEMKSRQKDLDDREMHRGEMVTPFEQAMRYARDVPGHKRPRYIITSNFRSIRVYDLDKPRASENYVEFRLADISNNLTVLHFLEQGISERSMHETQVSWEASKVIGKLYTLLQGQYHDPRSPESQHSLNVLCVRLVFCLFAEDALIFPKDELFNYLHGHTAPNVRTRLQLLFAHLAMPVEERDIYNDELARFPYINGGLFEETVTIPTLTQEIVDVLVNEASEKTDWSQISPTVFGGLFESTLNPETRRTGGMHYTSPENIHRVIDPLFLDSLWSELDDIINMRGRLEGMTAVAQANDFRAFQNKLASLTFFDPACGSGNFLTETYISLRRLENTVLTHLSKGQTSLGIEDVADSPVKVSLRQFHGIEINDFAVAVAQTALWIAELQANQETSMIVTRTIDDLPLSDTAQIELGNALEIDWATILNPADCSYLIGNPPFVYGDSLDKNQKIERAAIFGPRSGHLDYVACWFMLASRYAKGTRCETAFVATSSICQGSQVTAIWKPIIDGGMYINFAHRAFTWANETKAGAAVHVVIIGFSYHKWEDRLIIRHDGPSELDQPYIAKNINAYLLDAPNAYIAAKRSAPLGLPRMSKGFQPTGGALLVDAKTYDEETSKDPRISPYIRRFTQAKQFITDERSYIIWLYDEDLPAVADIPFLRTRVEASAEFRTNSKIKTGDAYKLRNRPHRPRETSAFVDNTDYLLIPRHTTHRRRYVPIGFVEKAEIIPGDAASFVPTSDRYIMGVLISRLHTLWLSIAGGRIREDFRYGSDTVYNTFPWVHCSDEKRITIADLTTAVINERKRLAGRTLEEMYDPSNARFFPSLINAHEALDKFVYETYGIQDTEDESAVQTQLFEMYLKANS